MSSLFEILLEIKKKICIGLLAIFTAVVGYSNQALAAEITGTLASPVPTLSTANTAITNTTDNQAGVDDAVSYDVDGDVTILAGSDIDSDATIFVHDSSGGGEALIIGTLDIAASQTLSVVLGQESSTAGTTASDFADVTFGVISGAGNLTIGQGAPGVALGANAASVITFNGAASDYGNLTINGGSGAAGFTGQIVTIANLSTTSLTATNITITGGTGGPLAADTAGLLTLTDATGTVAVTGTYAISAGAGGVTTTAATGGTGGNTTITEHAGAVSGGTYTISGGAGGTGAGVAGQDNGAGGLLTLSAHAGAVSSTTFNLQGGAGGDGAVGGGGAGGDIDIEGFAGAITATTVNIKGGAGGDGLVDVVAGDAGAGGSTNSAQIITSQFGASGNPVTFNILGGDAGTAGAGTNAAGGAAGAGGTIGIKNTGSLTFQTGAIFANTTVQGGAGSAAGASGVGIGGAGADGGAVTVTLFDTVHTGDMTATGGAGASGADGAAAVNGGNSGAGGAVTLTDFNTGLTGDLTVQAGLGGSGGTGGTTGVGGNGDAGGLVLISSIDAYAGSAATGGAVSIIAGAGGTGGAGSATAAGDGGTAGAGGNATVTMDTGSADISTLVVTSGAGGAGGAGGFTGSTSQVGGTAGVATLNITGTAAEITTATITGGDAGAAGASNTLVGITGTTGGATVVTIDVAVTAQGATGTSEITIAGGAGGAGGAGSSTFAGVAGTAGGNSTLDLGSTTAVAANITLNDGDTGATGATNTLAGGTGGAGGSAILNVTGAKTITGNITAASTGEGAINTSGGLMTMAGDIGTSSVSVLSLTTGNAAGISTNGSLYIDGIDIGTVTPGVLAFTNTTTEQIVSGTIEGTGAAGGADDINANAAGGTVTFNGAVGRTIANAALAGRVDTITTGTGTTTFASNVDAQTLVVGAGTVSFNDLVTVNGVASVANTATVTLATGIVAGETVMTSTNGGAALITTAATVNMPEAFTSGTIILHNDASDTAGQATADAAKITFGSNVLSTYTAQVNAGDVGILEVVATKKSSSTIATNLGISTAAASALDGANTALAGATSAQDVATLAALNTALAAGGATAAQAAEQMQGSPANLSAAGSAAVSATGSQVIAVGSSRLASLRSGAQFASSQASGFAGGADANDYGVWMKPFVNFGDQNQRTGIAGYETETYGMALGGDVKVGDSRRTTIGGSFSYSFTDIDSKGAGNAQTDIDGFQGTLYADYTTNEWYVEGLVGYARNEIDTSRSITAGALTATADYGSNQFMVNIGGGMPMEIAKNHFFTPNATFQYTLVENETYTEEGAGAMNLRVDQDEVHIAMGIFGARYHTHTELGGGAFTPEIRTALTYDFAGDEGQSTSTFNGGGAAFSVQGADVVQLGYTAGLGLSYAPLEDQGLTISANYDWNQKTDFVGHSGNFALRYEF